MTLDEAKKVKVGDKVIARVGALSLPVECEVINIIPGIERIKFDLDYQSEDGKWKHVKRTHMRCWKIREILEQDKDVSNETRSALSDRRPSKLTRLNLISVKMSTPEQMLEAYNSLVDAYNTLIDGYIRLLDERIAELKEQKRMNEKQNADGTWSKAEPIKASWEDNKILRFFRELSSNDKCFSEHKGKDGKCHGLYGGDRFTDYLNYGCIGCKHLDLIVRIKKEEKND